MYIEFVESNTVQLDVAVVAVTMFLRWLHCLLLFYVHVLLDEMIVISVL